MTIEQNTNQWVKQQLLTETTGHDWYHIVRVTKVARQIAKKEKADLFVVTMAALMHDLADDKVVDDENEGIDNIRTWLMKQEVDEFNINHILEIIQTISFKGGTGKPVRTLEAEVVQDADRIDAIGAIGIARTFQFSGAKGQAMYDPDISVRRSMTTEEYRLGKSSAIHHFYEKLLKLKDLMNTETGSLMAKERHSFLEQYLENFFDEWQTNLE